MALWTTNQLHTLPKMENSGSHIHWWELYCVRRRWRKCTWTLSAALGKINKSDFIEILQNRWRAFRKHFSWNANTLRDFCWGLLKGSTWHKRGLRSRLVQQSARLYDFQASYGSEEQPIKWGSKQNV